MRLLQLNKYSTLNGGSEVVADIVARAGERAGCAVATLGYSKPGQEHIHGFLDLGPERMGPSTMFRNRRLVQTVLDHARRFRPDAILHHNVYHHFPIAQLVDVLDRELGVPQSIILHDHKAVCPVYTGLRGKGVCLDCAGGRYWNAIVHRCKDGSLVRSAILAADSVWNSSVCNVYARFHAVICPSRFLARNVEGIAGGRRIEVLSNPCPPVADVRAPRKGIVFASRLSQEKGVCLLTQLAAEAPDIEIRVAGDGPMKAKLEESSEEHDNLRLLGRLTRAEVGDLLSKSEYLILPSLGTENNPMIGLEALAHGTPILGSDRGGIPELVGDSRGLLFDPSDPRASIAAILEMVRSPRERWERMHRACLEWASTNSEDQYFARVVAHLR